MPEALPITEALVNANARALEMAAFCELRIAENRLTPQARPKPWYGREEVVAECIVKFNVGADVADIAVDQAVLNLTTQRGDDPRLLQKRSMSLRIAQIEKLIIKYIENGRSEATYKYIRLGEIEESEWPLHFQQEKKRGVDIDPTIQIEVKMKEKRVKGIDMSAVAQWIQLTKLEAELDGLTGTDDGAAAGKMAAIFDQLDNLASKQQEIDEQKKKERGFSRAQAAKQLTLAEATSPEHRAMLATILDVAPTPVTAKRKRGRPRKNPLPDVEESEKEADDDSDD